MKKTIALLAAMAALTGCTSLGISKEDACQGALFSYSAYMAVNSAAQRKPTETEIYWAKVGATILQQQCGWETIDAPVVASTMRNRAKSPLVDANGVLKLLPPE